MREQRVRAAGAVSNNDIKIAVLEEQMKTVHKIVEIVQNELQSHMKTSAEQNKEIMKTIADKNEKIMETLNKGKGAFTFAVLASGAIGAIIAWASKVLLLR